ncbi:DUF2860 family protein [Pseudomonas sp. D(2018)]|uniref:DUF2860 family protein n=1 Tax=Pseudomonas sp. D(2018) TaxID=2502238 RepID=UPI001484F50F|nr:DUF2860 family protein [Pseudomonas sp. D(2018)]
MNRIVLAILGSAAAVSANAYDRIPQESGFSGFAFIGAGSTERETNMIATVGGTEVADERIDSLTQSPDSERYGKLLLDFGLSYTFADSRTQIFGGTELEDFLTQDSTFGLGVRQGIGDAGNLRASFIASTPMETWEDPYLVGADREETDVKSGGMRLGWEHIFGSGLELTYTKRSVELDDELSGTALGLTAAQRDLLDREGDLKELKVSYFWQAAPGHVLTPSFSQIDHDLDGDAMAMDGYQAELNYAYTGMQDWEFVVNLLAGKLESDDDNPIYGKSQDLDRMGLSLAATYKEPFGLQDWRARAAISYGEEDSNIDFYDTKITSLNLGMLYTF